MLMLIAATPQIVESTVEVMTAEPTDALNKTVHISLHQVVIDAFSHLIDIMEAHPATVEFVICFVSVIFGAVVTCWINNYAMRKQCQFNMIYEILKDERKKIEKAWKSMEKLELSISFAVAHPELEKKNVPIGKSSEENDDTSIIELHDQIRECGNQLLKINEDLRDIPPVLYKYVTADMVESSAKRASDFIKLFYHSGDSGIWSIEINDSITQEQLEKLRSLVQDLKRYWMKFIDAEDKLMSPGLGGKIGRKTRGLRKIGRMAKGAVCSSKEKK